LSAGAGGRGGGPGRLERALVRRYGRTPGSRIRLAAAVRALAVLVRRHPRAAADMAAAGAIQAARTGVRELHARLGAWERPAEPPAAEAREARRPLTRRERRRFRRLLDGGGQGVRGCGP
jgi:hypothetical protein